jgi:hypothetical protein
LAGDGEEKGLDLAMVEEGGGGFGCPGYSWHRQGQGGRNVQSQFRANTSWAEEQIRDWRQEEKISLDVVVSHEEAKGEEQIDQAGEVIGDPGAANKGKEVANPEARTGEQEGSQVLPQESGSLANKREDDGTLEKGMNKAAEILGDIPFSHRCIVTGHLLRDCRRMGGYQGMACGHQGHGGAEQNLSDYVATICATQVDGQAFFCIPNRSSESHASERSTTAIASVVKEIVTAR